MLSTNTTNKHLRVQHKGRSSCQLLSSLRPTKVSARRVRYWYVLMSKRWKFFGSGSTYLHLVTPRTADRLFLRCKVKIRARIVGPGGFPVSLGQRLLQTMMILHSQVVPGSTRFGFSFNTTFTSLLKHIPKQHSIVSFRSINISSNLFFLAFQSAFSQFLVFLST